jgi:multidrug resistance protein, MATE family
MRSERQELVIAELKRQLWLAVPLSSVGILQYILQTISIVFVGHLGTLPLSGASMATSFASVTGFTLLVYTFISFFSTSYYIIYFCPVSFLCM